MPTPRTDNDNLLSSLSNNRGILCFTALCRDCIFYKLKVCGSSVEQVYWHHYFQHHWLTLCLCHSLVLNSILNFCIMLQCSVMLLLLIVLRHHELCPYKMAHVNAVCLPTAPLTSAVPLTSLFPETKQC